MKISIADTALNRTALHEAFASAKPFPLLIVDDFLPPNIACGVLDEIDAYQEFQKSNDYIFAKNKYENSNIENLGSNGKAIKELFLSSEMASILSQIFGQKLFVDPDFIGGGLHRGGEGSFLDMHADFNLHPVNPRWIRELNVLLYLNRDWKPEYGGNLELRHSHTGETASVEPRFNRLVLMLTKDFTLHGYKPINFPAGKFRTSIATYAYSEALSEESLAGLKTTTMWVPDKSGLVKTLVARITPKVVQLKQRLFGSSTARNK